MAYRSRARFTSHTRLQTRRAHLLTRSEELRYSTMASSTGGYARLLGDKAPIETQTPTVLIALVAIDTHLASDSEEQKSLHTLFPPGKIPSTIVVFSTDGAPMSFSSTSTLSSTSAVTTLTSLTSTAVAAASTTASLPPSLILPSTIARSSTSFITSASILPYLGLTATGTSISSSAGSSNTTAPDTSTSSSGSNTAAIAGGVVGSMAGLVLVGLAVFFWRRRHREDTIPLFDMLKRNRSQATVIQTISSPTNFQHLKSSNLDEKGEMILRTADSGTQVKGQSHGLAHQEARARARAAAARHSWRVPKEHRVLGIQSNRHLTPVLESSEDGDRSRNSFGSFGRGRHLQRDPASNIRLVEGGEGAAEVAEAYQLGGFDFGLNERDREQTLEGQAGGRFLLYL